MKELFVFLWRVFLLIFGFFSVAFGGICVLIGADGGSASGAFIVALIGAVSAVVGVVVFTATVRAIKNSSGKQAEVSQNSGEEQA